MGMFHTTHWSLVMRAAEATPQARDALSELCRAYRAPILAYVRHSGCPASQVEDLTQGFFLELLEHRVHAHADPARGRFRSFLLTALQRHLVKVRVHDMAIKRGGGTRHEPLDDARACAVPDDPQTSPERAFEHAWARTVIQHALERLMAESEQAGRAALFRRLRPFLLDKPDAEDYASAARELALRRNTLAVAVHRMRSRLRQLIQRELAQTVTARSDLKTEMRALREALGGGHRHPRASRELPGQEPGFRHAPAS